MDPPKPAVATRARTEQGRADRCATSAGGKVTRSRSPFDESDKSKPTRCGKTSDLADLMRVVQAQVSQMAERISTLEVAHVTGREVISSFADRLVEENAKIDARLAELQAATGGHLLTVEDTFQRCSRAMDEPKAASHAASSAAAHALASSVGAASSTAAPSGVTRTDLALHRTEVDRDLALLRGQVDSGSATQQALDEKVTSLDTAATAQQLDTQSAFCELTTLVLAAHSRVRELESKHAAAHDGLCADIQTTVPRTRWRATRHCRPSRRPCTVAATFHRQSSLPCERQALRPWRRARRQRRTTRCWWRRRWW